MFGVNVKNTKTAVMPAIRIERWRVAQYKVAYKRWKAKTGSPATFSEWIRMTLDDECEAIFEAYGEPSVNEWSEAAQKLKAELS